MDEALIDKLAQVRGIGDAYRNYRGELQHFTEETKVGILNAMGCVVDDSNALAAEIAQVETARWRKFLPAVATGFQHRHALDSNLVEGVFYRIELGGLDNRFDFGHLSVLPIRSLDNSRKDLSLRRNGFLRYAEGSQ